MSFRVLGDRLYQDGAQVEFVATPNVSGRMHPDAIVIHETAGRLNPGSSVSWLAQKKAKASAHLVIERDGTITQMADFDRQTWHAGKSKWKGRSGVNRFAIGIEVVNPGKLVKAGNVATPWFGAKYDIDEYGLQEARTRYHGTGWWMPWTEAQIAAVRQICGVLSDHYRIDAKDIVGHYHISPGRKVDPSPLCDIEALRQYAREETSLPSPTRHFLLAMGSRGPEVETVQRRLRALGYKPGPPDGIYGSRTRAAVLAWEAEQERVTDGKVDEADMTALGAVDAKEMPETPLVAEAKEKKVAAQKKVDATSAVAAAGFGMASLVPEDAWGVLIGGLDRLLTLTSKLVGLGVKVPPQFIFAAVGVTVVATAWQWSRKAWGDPEE